MRAWFEERCADDVRSRTVEQRAWDSAILAASEYVRRRTNYDERFALEIHDLLSTKLPKSLFAERRPSATARVTQWNR
jgi:hypothetical protein